MSLRRRGSASLSSTSYSSSSLLSDIDAITPCPALEKKQKLHPEVSQSECADDSHEGEDDQHDQQSPESQHEQRPKTPRRSASWRAEDEGHFNPAAPMGTADGEEVDNELLWKRMLAIQRIFGCYRSARMSAALESGVQDGGGVPSKTCLDLLNDSIDSLPEESRRQLDQFLQFGRVAKRRSSKSLWWKQMLHLHNGSGPSFKA